MARSSQGGLGRTHGDLPKRGVLPVPSENHSATWLRLSIEDKVRLQKFAPLFDIEFSHLDERTCLIRSSGGVPLLEKKLPCDIAYTRLLMEICERAIHWVHFHVGESCHDTFLGQSDARIERVAVLYGLDRDAKEAFKRARAKGADLVDRRI